MIAQDQHYEEWRPVDGFPEYIVSDYGRVMRILPGGGARRCRVLTPYADSRGYMSLSLSRDGKRYMRRLHAIVTDAFIRERGNGEEVNHLDGNKTNNRLDNLEVVTRDENREHAKRNGLLSCNSGGNWNKLSDDQVAEIRQRIKGGDSMSEIAESYGVSRCTIYSIKSGRTHRRSFKQAEKGGE